MASHIPMVCRKCQGPMTATLACTKCKKQGRIHATRFAESPLRPWDHLRLGVFDSGTVGEALDVDTTGREAYTKVSGGSGWVEIHGFGSDLH